MGKPSTFLRNYQQSNGSICSCCNITYSVPAAEVFDAVVHHGFHLVISEVFSFTHVHCPGIEEGKCCVHPEVASTTTFLQTSGNILPTHHSVLSSFHF
jgi:hypothetical protein